MFKLVFVTDATKGEYVMKIRQPVISLLLGSLVISAAHTAYATEIILKGEKAKHLYNTLTGSAVQNEGAAGHLYREGKSILCRYTDVDITTNGKIVPPDSPCRYACSISINHNGYALPGPNP